MVREGPYFHGTEVSPRTIFSLNKLVRRTENFGPPNTFPTDQFSGDSAWFLYQYYICIAVLEIADVLHVCTEIFFSLGITCGTWIEEYILIGNYRWPIHVSVSIYTTQYKDDMQQ